MPLPPLPPKPIPKPRPLPPPSFLSAVHQGNNDWWRYLMAVGLIGSVFFVLTAALSTLALGLGWISLASDGSVTIRDPLVSYLLSHLPFGFLGLGLWWAVVGLHHRPCRTLIRACGSLRWGRMAQGAAIWLALIISPLAVALLLNPGSLMPQVDWNQWLRLLGLAMVLTPMQIAVEELFFRGYLLQASGLLTQKPWILCLVNGILFMIVHLDNPETGYGLGWLALYYAGFGIFTTWITLRDQGLELALGMHAANNGFVILLVSYGDAVVETPALFSATSFDAAGVVLAFAVRALGFCALFFGIPGLRRDSVPPLQPQGSASEKPPGS
ncbi:MAG: CPBP family intramembrane metalloprotease [Synechococcaceae cyanobacterium SM2_3_2]|nr:CPBP family intramembrane metalloprotease [Synechococcaceae cyanobacterium SM2_3_2]